VPKRLLDHQQSEPSDIVLDRPDAPEDLIALCKKMMSKNPHDRQQSAKEVVHDFEDWLVRNGYAEEEEFGERGSSGTGKFRVRVNMQKIADNSHLLLQSAQEPSDQAEEGLETSVLGATEDNINLFGGSEAGSAVMSLSGMSGQRRGNQAAQDSALTKLNDIERERTMRFRRESAHPLSVRTPQKKAPLVETQQMQAVAQEDVQLEVTDWYRYVPFWFWTLFLSGYVAAIFFAGILVALLTVFFGSTTAK